MQLASGGRQARGKTEKNTHSIAGSDCMKTVFGDLYRIGQDKHYAMFVQAWPLCK